MNQVNLLEFLTNIIATQMHSASAATSTLPQHNTTTRTTRGPGMQPGLGGIASKNQGIDPLPARIANELLNQAIKNGMTIDPALSSKNRLGGGNTAELVCQISLNLPFAFKFDQKTEKLTEEAKTMRRIKQDINLPPIFRDAWASIYAIYEQGPPYAYLMEYFPPEAGWRSLEDRLYNDSASAPSTSDVLRWMSSVLDILFTGYEHSVNKRSRPNLDEDYCSRIEQRLIETERYEYLKLGTHYFESRPLVINGTRYRPWRDYVALLNRHAGFIDKITPPFTTVAHGDPNPGNLMLKIELGSVTVKIIDPKDWTTGDYLFDVSKLTHFLRVTGPAEYAQGGVLPQVLGQEQEDGFHIDYTLAQPSWTALAEEACLSRAAELAKNNHDHHWLARYELGMAANLLGLPLGRLKREPEPRFHAAVIFLCEGLYWLDKFCARLEPDIRTRLPLYAPPEQVEPPSIAQARAWVQARLPHASSHLDPRGFVQWQWPAPARLADPAKLAGLANPRPWEMSFEHEARLRAPESGDNGLQRLISILSQVEVGGKTLLPNDAQFHAVRIERIARAAGAQSIDQYYDSPDPASGLITRQITLRERIQTSAFMSWQGDDTLRAFNLEMPFVAIGSNGVTARLEFNWIDQWQHTRADCLDAANPDARLGNPLAIAADYLQGIAIAQLAPRLQHSTYRQKFAVLDATDQRIHVINIDHVMAQDLVSGRTGSYVDVDIASVAKINEKELKRLNEFVSAIAEEYQLLPNPFTKAYRDALVVSMLDSAGKATAPN